MRVANHIPFLRKHGVELQYAPTLSPDEYALLVSRANPAKKAVVLARSALRATALVDHRALLLVHRLLTLVPTLMIDPPRRLDVYDFDDALLEGSPADSNRHFQWTKRERSRAITSMRRARLVIAANATLAFQAVPYARRVEVVPSCVDPQSQQMRLHEDRDITTIGWIGSHTTVSYLRPLIPIIERLNSRGQRAKLVVVGADSGIRADWLEHRQWSLLTQADDLADFDIGVMPLPDTTWAQGKSGYKLLQYFSAGVPAVASPVGVNADLVGEGRGLSATTAHEWENALAELLTDASGRQQRGMQARRYVEQHYSYERWAPELAALLHSVR